MKILNINIIEIKGMEKQQQNVIKTLYNVSILKEQDIEKFKTTITENAVNFVEIDYPRQIEISIPLADNREQTHHKLQSISV